MMRLSAWPALALALSARSIRIEAPIPGEPYVGIEIPNSAFDLVTLKEVLASPNFDALGSRSTLAFALGQDVATRIPGATFVPLDGTDHLPWRWDVEALVRPVREFLPCALPPRRFPSGFRPHRRASRLRRRIRAAARAGSRRRQPR